MTQSIHRRSFSRNDDRSGSLGGAATPSAAFFSAGGSSPVRRGPSRSAVSAYVGPAAGRQRRLSPRARSKRPMRSKATPCLRRIRRSGAPTAWSCSVRRWPCEVSRVMAHRESHRTEHIGWLRAAVLGANDGLISTSSLVVGVAAADTGRDAVLLRARHSSPGPSRWPRASTCR
jgi:hypothetical protein